MISSNLAFTRMYVKSNYFETLCASLTSMQAASGVICVLFYVLVFVVCIFSATDLTLLETVPFRVERMFNIIYLTMIEIQCTSYSNLSKIRAETGEKSKCPTWLSHIISLAGAGD